MRNYTALDMMRIVRMSKESKYKHLSRFKLLQAYKKEFPELSNEQKLYNLKVALGINCSKVLNHRNHNHYITMCRRYAKLEYDYIPEAKINKWFTKIVTKKPCDNRIDYRVFVTDVITKKGYAYNNNLDY